jgi:hypothetical protein
MDDTDVSLFELKGDASVTLSTKRVTSRVEKGDTHVTPSVKNQKIKPLVDPGSTELAGSRFDEFWSVYPKKVKRKGAEKIWRSKKLDRNAEQIIADVTNRARSDRSWLDGFIPHPTTYLNGERWNDEDSELKPVAGPSGSVPYWKGGI